MNHKLTRNLALLFTLTAAASFLAGMIAEAGSFLHLIDNAGAFYFGS